MIKIICIAAFIALSSCQSIKFLHASNNASHLVVSQFGLNEDNKRVDYIKLSFPVTFDVETTENDVTLIPQHLNEEIKRVLFEASEAIEENAIKYIVYFDDYEGKINIDTKNEVGSSFYKSSTFQVIGNKLIVTLESSIAERQYAEFELIIYDNALLNKVLNILNL